MLADSLLLKPGHLLRVASQRAMAIFAELAGPHGITPAQWAVLEAARERPGVPLSVISEVVTLNKATVGTVVARLAGRGLVEVGQLPGDRRTKTATVTAEGEAMSRYMAPLVEETQRILLARLSEDERTTLLTALRRLIDAPPLNAEQALASAPAELLPGETASPAERAAVIGVGHPVGRAVAVHLAACHWALRLYAREGYRAQDLANMLRVSGFRRVGSGRTACSRPGESAASVAAVLEELPKAGVAVFCAWGTDRDHGGPLATDVAVIERLLEAMASTGDVRLCIICSGLAHAAPDLDRRWREAGARVAGVDVNGCGAKMAAEFTATLAAMGAAAGGTVVAPRSQGAPRTED